MSNPPRFHHPIDGVIGGDFLDHLATTDRLHGDLRLELVAVGTALTHG